MTNGLEHWFIRQETENQTPPPEERQESSRAMPEPDYRQVLKYMNEVRETLGEESYETLNKHVMERTGNYFHSEQIMEEVANVLRGNKSLLQRFNMFLQTPLEIWTTEEANTEIIITNWVEQQNKLLYLGKLESPNNAANNITTQSLVDEDEYNRDHKVIRSEIYAEIKEDLKGESYKASKAAFLFCRDLYKDNEIKPDHKDVIVEAILEAKDKEKITFGEAVYVVELLQNKRPHIMGIRYFFPDRLHLKLWKDEHGDEHLVIQKCDEKTAYGNTLFYQDLGTPVPLEPSAFDPVKTARPVLKLELTCHHCGRKFVKHEHSDQTYPIPSAVCEHSICHPCWFEAIENKKTRGKFMNCPMPECDMKKAFETEHKYPNMLAMEVMVKLKDAKEEIKFLDKKFHVVRMEQYNKGDPFAGVSDDVI